MGTRGYRIRGTLPNSEWVDVNERKPVEYELVKLLFEGSEKAYSAWWTGRWWDSGKWMPDKKPVAWRRHTGVFDTYV